MAAFTVEVARTVSFTDWATYLVYADTPEAAKALAQVKADEANAATFYEEKPFSWNRDDGEEGGWSAQDPTAADDQDELHAEEHMILGEPPEDDDEADLEGDDEPG